MQGTTGQAIIICLFVLGISGVQGSSEAVEARAIVSANYWYLTSKWESNSSAWLRRTLAVSIPGEVT